MSVRFRERREARLQRLEILRVGDDVGGAQLRGLLHQGIARRFSGGVEARERGLQIAFGLEHAACSIIAITR